MELRTILYKKIELSEQDRRSLARFLSRGCRKKTKQAILSRCLYGLSSVCQCELLTRIELTDGNWQFFAGQSYTDEFKNLRKLFI